MTPAELATECARVIESGTDMLVLELLRPPGGSELVRLSGPYSPVGALLSELPGGLVVAQFDARDVLSWLAARQLVVVEAKVKP